MAGSQVSSKKITLEAIQLFLSNSERIYQDSFHVSVPTSASLLELSLEEVAKAWGLTLTLEKRILRKVPNLFDKMMKRGQVRLNKNEIKNLDRFLETHEARDLLMPFDVESFRSHRVKIRYLSILLDYLKATIPVSRKGLKRVALMKAVYGRYIKEPTKEDVKNMDAIVDKVLVGLDTDYLEEIVKLKERGFYVDYERSGFISPSTRLFQLDQIRNLAALLMGMLKSELNVLEAVYELP